MFAPVYLATWYPQNLLIAAIFHASHRILWAASLSWIIYACCTTNCSGPLGWFLGLPHWQLLSKLCYCIYLLHMTVITIQRRLARTEIYFHGGLVFQEAVGVFVTTALISVGWTLLFEMPFSNLDIFVRRLFNKFSNGSNMMIHMKLKSN